MVDFHNLKLFPHPLEDGRLVPFRAFRVRGSTRPRARRDRLRGVATIALWHLGICYREQPIRGTGTAQPERWRLIKQGVHTAPRLVGDGMVSTAAREKGGNLCNIRGA